MVKKAIILIIISIMATSIVGCSDDEASEENMQIEGGQMGDGSQRRGGQDKLDRINSGQGGRKNPQ